jgi:hypothetical protein
MRRLQNPLLRLSFALVVALASFTALPARAADYTDLWWVPSESGWGVNVVQTDNFMFLTFFIYGQDHKPTWYSADLLLDATGAFTGGLFATTGSYYAAQWNTADVGAAQQVGNASFKPSSTNAYEATLTYVVDGVGTVIKNVSRLPLTPPVIGGAYTGGISGLQTSCNNSGSNGAYKASYDLQVTQTPAGAATFTFTYPTYVCTLSGTLVQHGRQYTMSGATYRCAQNNNTIFSGSADLSEIVGTAQGVEGRWTANTGGGCRETAQFSAVLL